MGVLLIAASNQHQLNDDIRDKEVRLIGSNGEQMGIYSSADARRIAAEQSFDLVKISPQANPPVCKIMDYGKYRFEQAKRDKEAKRNQHVVEVKEIRLTPSIGDNDFGWKLNDGKRFLAGGDRLKVTVRFRKGREMAHTEIGRTVLEKFAEECKEIANVDKNPKLEGRAMSMFLSPKSGKEAKAEKAKKERAAAAAVSDAASEPEPAIH